MSRYFDLWDNQTKKKRTVKTIRKEGIYWITLCPFHPDQNRPNLHIDEERKTYHCFACGRSGHLYDQEYRQKNDNHRKIAETYDYQNINNQLAFQVVRYHPKGFCQRRPDGNGGWTYNLKGIKPVPYRLPELMNSHGKVFVVEGEKDTDNLMSWGLTVTTSPMGANKWKKEYNRYFKAREIILLPDNDSEGLRHMQKIAKGLLPIAKSIKLIKLPNLKQKEDISDWIGKNNTKEELLKLVEDTAELHLEDLQEMTKDSKKKKITEQTRTLIPNIIHLVQDQDQVKYLVKEDDHLEMQEFYQENEIRYRPKQILPFKLVTPSIVKRPFALNLEQLYKEVDAFIRSYLEMPEEAHYLILNLWVFHTYLIEKFHTTPILYFYGVKETGKTRAGEVLGELAFRAQRMTSITEATLFRSTEMFKPVIIIDEIKLWGQGANQGLQDLLKTVYKRGLKVARINNDKKGEDKIEYFDTFSPVTICTTEELPDIIESRCIHFVMQKNFKSDIEDKIDQDWANDLRERLTLFRAINMDVELSETKPIARRRLKEIISPLHQVLILINPDKEKELIEAVQRIDKAKHEEEGMSLEAEIISAVNNKYSDNGEPNILTRAITALINEGRNDKD